MNSSTSDQDGRHPPSTLEHLGFKKREIAAAMEKTKTRVGTAELTIQQRIAIALRPITVAPDELLIVLRATTVGTVEARPRPRSGRCGRERRACREAYSRPELPRALRCMHAFVKPSTPYVSPPFSTRTSPPHVRLMTRV